MITDKHRHIVSGLIPLGFVRHVIINGAAIDLQTFKSDILHLVLFIVTVDDTEVRQLTVIADVAEGDVLNAETRSLAVFLVPGNLHLQDTALWFFVSRGGEFDADVIKCHVAHKVVVTTIDGETALIVYLLFALTEDVDILIKKVFHGIAQFGIGSCRSTMQSDEDGMNHICPKGGIAHTHIARRTAEALACSIGSSTVITVATENTVIEYIRRSKYIQAVAPTRVRDAPHIVERHNITTAHRTGIHDETVN